LVDLVISRSLYVFGSYDIQTYSPPGVGDTIENILQSTDTDETGVTQNRLRVVCVDEAGRLKSVKPGTWSFI